MFVSTPALSTYNPAVFVLNEMLKQHLAMIRQLMESRRHLHCSLVRSLEPPNYRYTRLEDTKQVKLVTLQNIQTVVSAVGLNLLFKFHLHLSTVHPRPQTSQAVHGGSFTGDKMKENCTVCDFTFTHN